MQDGPPLPWDVAVAIYGGTLYRDSQTVERLAERGGGGWDEVAYMWKHAKLEHREACVSALAKLREPPPAQPSEEAFTAACNVFLDALDSNPLKGSPARWTDAQIAGHAGKSALREAVIRDAVRAAYAAERSTPEGPAPAGGKP
jgi:hypothetical protein